MPGPNDPVTAPLTNPGSTQQPVPAVQVAAPQNIDPQASAPPAAPAAPTTTTTATTQTQAPSLAAPAGANGNYTLDQMLAQPAQAVQQANVDVANIWDQIQKQQTLVDSIQNDPASIANPAKLTSASQTLNALYGTLSQAEAKLEAANASYSSALLKGIDTVQLTPEQKQLYSAQADSAKAQAAQANANAKVITDGSEGQRALTAAQAGLASANAAAAEATAKATAAKTPAEIQQLQAQAAALNAQAASTNALLPGLAAKQTAETNLTVAQTGLTDANSDLARANASEAQARGALQKAQADLLVPAQAGLAGAQAGLAGAQGAAARAGIQKDLLGPLYGLQDQVNAIRAIQQQVFGPGGSGNADEANKMLQDYVQSTVAGTTPYAANVAAANFLQNQYATGASMTNAAQAAAASRANALMGFGGSALGTLAGMNANAPAGSTAMAGAFQDVVNMMSNKTATGQYAPPQQPAAPQLPALLANLAHINQGNAPTAVTPPPSGPGPTTSAPVTINIGGGGGATTAPAVTTPSPMPSWLGSGGSGGQLPNASAGFPSWLGQGPQSNTLPGVLAQHAPASVDSVKNLWANEIGNGAVQLPTYTAPPSVPSVM